MNNLDKKRFMELMAMLEENFSEDKPISKQRVAIYFEHLKPYDIFDVEKAFHKTIGTRVYPSFPKVAEIIQAIENTEDMEIKAMEAWNKANKELPMMCLVERGGDDVSFNPLSEAIILAFGSWENFSATDPNDDRYERKRFIDSYKITAKKEHKERLLDAKKTRQLT